MKINFSRLSIVIIFLMMAILGCKKDPPKVIPSISTSTPTDITSTTATSGGTITNDGNSPVTSRGVCWGLNQSPTTSDNKTSDGSGIGSFISSISGLSPGGTSYVRAYATNSVGTAYGNQTTINSTRTPPVITTTELLGISSTSATGGGNITSDGGSAIIARGVCWSTNQVPTTKDSLTINGMGIGSFTSSINRLIPGTPYFIRAYATNSIGTGYGNQISFNTAASLPTISTTSATEITVTTATSGGIITNDGGAAITNRGVCWNTNENPTISNSKTTNGTGKGSFTSLITGLTPGTTYYIRAYATNSAGTEYGLNLTFTTKQSVPSIIFNPILTYGTITDIESNVYKTITIGTQNWMAQNLRATKYNDGSAIPLSYSNLTTPSYSWCNNDGFTNREIYGAVYNWYAVNTGKLCPSGMNIPTDSDWQTLREYIYNDGGKLKEIGTSHWKSPNTGATNESGFSAIPLVYNNEEASWWSATENLQSSYVPGTFASLQIFSNSLLVGNTSKSAAYSVRCVKSVSTSVPIITTSAITEITATSATSGGNISSDGGSAVIARGVCWSTSQVPTISDSKTTNGTGTGSFTSSITGLSPITTYYVRAYATNSNGTVYGSQVTFSTTERIATITTTAITEITATTATSGGNISTDGGSAVIARGVCWSTSQVPTISDSKTTNGTGTGTFVSSITGLSPGTTYYARAYATNSKGTAYGNQVNFTTSLIFSLATVTTSVATNITTTGATLGGNVTSDGNATVTERGVVYSTTQSPTTSNTKVSSGSGTGAYTVSTSSLSPNSIYYVRAFAINSQGTAYGTQMSFTTGVIPVAAFTATPTTITAGQNVQFTDQSTNTPTSWSWNFGDGGSSTSQNPSYTYSSAGTFTVALTANNSFGSNTLTKTNYIIVNSVSGGIIFSPNLIYGSVTDIDGNVYKTILIGTQTWMAENLKTTKYRNGNLIETTSPATLNIRNESTPKYQWAYDGNESNVASYGRLYTLYAATDSRNVCPTGWHLSTDGEWTTLTNYLGDDAGGKLKEIGTSHWLSPNKEAINSSGFTALPGGQRNLDGAFYAFSTTGSWWSSTYNYTTNAWIRIVHYSLSNALRDYADGNYGFSVRCVKDY